MCEVNQVLLMQCLVDACAPLSASSSRSARLSHTGCIFNPFSLFGPLPSSTQLSFDSFELITDYSRT